MANVAHAITGQGVFLTEITALFLHSLREKRFVATGRIFCRAAGDGAAPTVACSGAQTPAAPTNETAGAAGDTSRPYKWGLICRGRLNHQPPLEMVFVGAAGD